MRSPPWIGGWCSKEVVRLSEWECENIYDGWEFFEFS